MEKNQKRSPRRLFRQGWAGYRFLMEWYQLYARPSPAFQRHSHTAAALATRQIQQGNGVFEAD